MIAVRKIELAPDDPLLQAADKLEPELRQAFLDAIAAVKDAVDEQALADAISKGDIAQVMSVLDIHNRLIGALAGKGLAVGVQSVQQALQAAFAAGAAAAEFSLPEFISVGMSFNLLNPHTVEFLNDYTFHLIKQVTQQTRDAVQSVVTRAFQEGGHPFEQAREIRDSIGLTFNQERAVANYRRMLEQGDTVGLRESLTRSLRDGRYDRSLLSRISSGNTVMPQDRIDAMVARYRQRFIDYRARNIARTESLRAAGAGRRALWKQAVDQGVMAPTVKRTWGVSGDANTCIDCLALDGETVGLDEPFSDGTMDPPEHPSCRCFVFIQTNTTKRDGGLFVVKAGPEDEPRDSHGEWTSGGEETIQPEDIKVKQEGADVLKSITKQVVADNPELGPDNPMPRQGTAARRAMGAYGVLLSMSGTRGDHQNIIARDSKGNFLGALQVLGDSKGKVNGEPPLDPALHVLWLGVNPAILTGRIKAHGVGTRLMVEAARAAKGRSVKLTSMDSESDKFYKAIGMSKYGDDGFEWTAAQAKKIVAAGIAKDDDFDALTAIAAALNVEKESGPPLAGDSRCE